MKVQQMASINDVFERALEKIQARVFVSSHVNQPVLPAAFAVAYSGGLDSSVLLHLANAYARQHGIKLLAFHIHHGISPNADAWLQHCQHESASMGVEFEARHVKLVAQEKSGVEEAARLKRYAGLGELCLLHKVELLLTAHHQDDQAETILLQLLRGSGVAGLSGMDAANRAPDLLGNEDLLMARPLLTVSRAELEMFASTQKISFVDDESNSDPRYARNALRQQVMPSLAQYFPGFQDRFARSASHAQSAQRLLEELAAQDLLACLDGECLQIGQIGELSPDRCYNLLRYWFATRSLRMPSSAWLTELRSQLLEAKDDAQLCVTHPDCHIRRYRDRIFITPRLDDIEPDIEPFAFQWNGEKQIEIPRYQGILYFDDAAQGLDVAWLRTQACSLQLRAGGERLKLAANRPTKSLKYHYQSFDVPAWERTRLPVIWIGKQLLFAAGIGLDCQHINEESNAKISLRWESARGNTV
ncbi:MAG: tRNA lysidine(34) synthetase TilS [Pseudomonadota bacterium]